MELNQPITVTPTLPLLAGDLCFLASSPALLLWYINLPLFTSTINIEYLVKNKTDLVWDLAHFYLKTWIFLIRSMVSGAFLSLTKIISSIRILIVCKSCKTSYNVLSHSHWGLGQFFFFFGGGHWNSRGGVKKDSLQILGLQRLASLQLQPTDMTFWTHWRKQQVFPNVH